MLLYTVMPYDAIFGGDADIPQTETSSIPGGYVEWMRDGETRRISRVESTDPSVYLRADFAPGAPWRFPKVDNPANQRYNKRTKQ